MSFADKQLTCRDCGNSFLFTAGEQEFYASKGLQNEPVRCPPCRSARKSSRLTEPEDGYVKYGVFASFGGRTPRQMHPATCADCGMMTEVPFQPRGDRPVYCSNCYNKIKGAAEAEAEAAEAARLAGGTSGEAAEPLAETEPAVDVAEAEGPEEVVAEAEEAELAPEAAESLAEADEPAVDVAEAEGPEEVVAEAEEAEPAPEAAEPLAEADEPAVDLAEAEGPEEVIAEAEEEGEEPEEAVAEAEETAEMVAAAEEVAEAEAEEERAPETVAEAS